MNRIKEYFTKIINDKEKLRKTLAVLAVIPVLLIAFAVKSGAESEPLPEGIPETNASETSETSNTESGTICVDIGGAVESPMLAELPQGSRVEDAIVAAGGLTEDADISNINRAEFLEDGQKIYIPEAVSGVSDAAGASNGENSLSGDVASASPGVAGGSAAGGKININTADSIALQQLNGVGPATAQKIIDYRTSNGSFKSIEDIKNVSGIGDKTFEKLKDYITI